MKKRPVHIVVLAVLALLLAGPIPNSLARSGGSPRLEVRRPVPKAIDVGVENAAGYGTGTVIHADALRSGPHSLVGLDVAFSGSSWSSVAPVADIVNEVRRTVAPKLPDKQSFGRGTGLELGILSEPQALIGQLSTAAAPASTDLIHNVVGPIDLGILRAELLRSKAQARAVENGCVLGPDKSFGLGSVLNLSVLGGLIATNARPPYREVVQSSSSTRIVKGSTPDRLGLKSETRQTVAPVTFFKGTPIQFTIEILGEWALRAVADGVKGDIHYGPLNAEPQTPIARILNAKGQPVAELTTQMLLTQKGLHIELPGIAEIAIGEPPRMIGEPYGSEPIVEGGAAVAAVDVARVRLLNGQVADVRIGHMEAAVTVPDGGVQCPGLNVEHSVDPETVQPGDEFTYTITVTNPNDCVLQDVKVVETPEASAAGVKFEIASVDPPGGSVGGTETSADLGTLGPGETKTVTVKVTVPPDSEPGSLTALAVVEGVCPADLQPSLDPDGPDVPGSPATPDIPVRGEDLVEGPVIGAPLPAAPAETCTVPPLAGKTLEEAKAALEEAGCKLGQVTTDPDADPKDEGKVTDSNPDEGQVVPKGTEVDITIGGQHCIVPDLTGKTQAEAEDALKKAGCELGEVTPGPSGDPGTITDQEFPGGTVKPVGTEIDITVAGPATEVLGETETKGQTEEAGPAATGTGPTLVRTGGVALGGLALWLLASGLLTRAAGSRRLWRAVRDRNR